MAPAASPPATALLAALVLGGCAVGSGGPQNAHYEGSCGEGTVLFVDGTIGCPSTEPQSFVAFTSLPASISGPMTLTIGGSGVSGYTVTPSTCLGIASGELVIGDYESGTGSITGSYDVTYTDGSKGQGDFNASYCPSSDPCK
jgi:hypothetical protein